jgi:hypothetical protein
MALMDQIKITFIQGLQEVVIDEISKCDSLRGKIFLIERNDDSLFFNIGVGSETDTEEESENTEINIGIYTGLLSLKSVVNVFLVQRGEKLHPLQIDTWRHG